MKKRFLSNSGSPYYTKQNGNRKEKNGKIKLGHCEQVQMDSSKKKNTRKSFYTSCYLNYLI